MMLKVRSTWIIWCLRCKTNVTLDGLRVKMCQVLGTYASGRFTEDTAGEPLMKVIWGKQASTSSSQTGGGKASKPMMTRIDLCTQGWPQQRRGRRLYQQVQQNLPCPPQIPIRHKKHKTRDGGEGKETENQHLIWDGSSKKATEDLDAASKDECRNGRSLSLRLKWRCHGEAESWQKI